MPAQAGPEQDSLHRILVPLLAVLLWYMGSRELKMAHMMSTMFSYDQGGYRVREEPYYGDIDILPGTIDQRCVSIATAH